MIYHETKVSKKEKSTLTMTLTVARGDELILADRMVPSMKQKRNWCICCSEKKRFSERYIHRYVLKKELLNERERREV